MAVGYWPPAFGNYLKVGSEGLVMGMSGLFAGF
jgi:hypothetical protein